MLAGEAAMVADILMRICVSQTASGGVTPRRYKKAVCIPKLFPRRGLGRFLNFPVAVGLILSQARRERRRGRRVVLFVRNDPVYLLAASLLRRYVDRLVFQSSFPHEEYSGMAVKRWVARAVYRMSSRGVDIVTGVSPEGVRRAGKLCPHAVEGPHIPLLADLPMAVRQLRGEGGVKAPLTFLYAGTHRQGRELEMVLLAIGRAVNNGALARFRFVGASAEDEARLSAVPGVAALMGRNVISFERPVPRAALPGIMAEADVGISLIPPKPIYYESSPTKLAEYMGAGLAVLASRGIPMQERFVDESSGGLLVDWGVAGITEGIQALCAVEQVRDTYGENAAAYARQSLQYRSYLPQFRQLVGLV